MKRWTVALAAFLVFGSISYAQKVVIFQKKDKFGIKENDKTLVKPEYDAINSLYPGYFATRKNGQCGVINKIGTAVVSEIYDDVKYYGENTFLVKKGNKWGLVNQHNALILPVEYTGFTFITDDLCEIKANNKSGLINKSGNTVLTPIYDEIKPFGTDFFMAQANGKYGILDFSGKFLIPALYDSFSKIDGTDFYVLKLSNKIGLMDSSYKLLLDASYDNIEISPLGMTLHKGDKIGFYTSTGKVVEPVYSRILFIQPEFGLAVVKQGDKLGFVTAQGVVVPAQYENVSRFSSRGVAFVEKSGKLMAVNVNGKEMIVQDVMKMGYTNPPAK